VITCAYSVSREALILHEPSRECCTKLSSTIHQVGLLSRDNTEQIPFAYKLYTSTKESDEKITEGFKVTFCRVVPIDFVGVWDTVASVGVIMGRSLPFVDVNTTIRVFRQALSLDECRAKFRPNVYHRGPLQQPKIPTEGDGTQTRPAADEKFQTDVSEVWFAGCHADVGGGNAVNGEPHVLANIPLRWMIKQIVQSNAPILFDCDAFARWEGIPASIGQHPSQGGGNDAIVAALDAQDAVQLISDQLWKRPLWWLLEIFPTSFTQQDANNEWVTTFWPHCAGGRQLPSNPVFHRSVKMRMNDPNLKYKPAAEYEKSSETTYVS